MADVKFMDLSQNDNPATTDSVLIGNSTNGLKRTTIGAIGNVFAANGILHFETFTAHADPDPTFTAGTSKHIDILAPNVPGYTFEFWLSPALQNQVSTNYIADPRNTDTTVWVIAKTDYKAAPVDVVVTAVYVKSTMV